MAMSTPPSGPDPRPSLGSRPAAQYHDDLPDIFEPLPSDPHMLWAIEYMGIETPGELIDDAPVILPGDGDPGSDLRDDPASYWSSLPAEPDARSRGRRRPR
jgi:hypothetical protein